MAGDSNISQILTHPGGAHKDDFLACSLLVHVHRVPVVRREPTRADLDDPSILVVDVGNEHDPDRGNFDHHQFPKDHPPTCALSLVLQHLALYDDAIKFCDWLEPAEWLDSRGPNDTAKWLGVERDIITKLVSPMDVTLLRRFANHTEIEKSSVIWQMMDMVGEDLITYLRDLRERLTYIDQHGEFWRIDSESGPFEILYMPRTEPLPDEPSAGLHRYIEEKGKENEVIGLIYPDRRGPGYGLSRYDDNLRLDFSELENRCDDVHFAHARGFVCKTSATGRERLETLMKMAFRG